MNKKKIIILLTILLVVWNLAGCGEEKSLLLKDTEMVLIQEEEGEAVSDAASQLETTKEKQVETSNLFVHICGAVHNPGVYELDEGSRVYEAVEAAGGFLPESAGDYVNLAAMVVDGDKIVIPTVEEILAAKESGGTLAVEEAGATAQGSRLVNINTASVQELCTVTGIGTTRAEAIIAYREKSGGFSAIEDIMKVDGIKEGMFSKIADEITVR